MLATCSLLSGATGLTCDHQHILRPVKVQGHDGRDRLPEEAPRRHAGHPLWSQVHGGLAPPKQRRGIEGATASWLGCLPRGLPGAVVLCQPLPAWRRFAPGRSSRSRYGVLRRQEAGGGARRMPRTRCPPSVRGSLPCSSCRALSPLLQQKAGTSGGNVLTRIREVITAPWTVRAAAPHQLEFRSARPVAAP